MQAGGHIAAPPANARRPGRPVLLYLAVVFVAVGAGALLGAAALSTGGALVVATATTLAIPIVRRLANGTFDIFEPLIAFALAYGVMFVVRPAYMLVTGVGEQYYSIAGVPVGIADTIQEMQVIALVGAVAFVVGYELRLADRLGNRMPSIPRSSPASLGTAGFALLALGGALTALYIRSQGGLSAIFAGRSEAYFQSVAGTSKYLYYAPTLLVPAALLLFGSWRATHRWVYAGGSLVAVAVLFAARGPVGSRLAFLPLVGGLIIYLYLERRRRPGLVASIAVLCAALAISAIVGEARNASDRNQGGVVQVAQSLMSSPEHVFTPLTEGADAAMAPGLAAALTVVPEQVPHTYGAATVGDLAARAIPRSLWPSKPQPPRERVVALLWRDSYARGTANPEFSALFSWYMDGALFGVVIGLTLYGFLARASLAYFRANESALAARLAFAALVPSVVMTLRDSPTDSFVRLLFTVVPIVLAAFIVGAPVKSQGPGPAKAPA